MPCRISGVFNNLVTARKLSNLSTSKTMFRKQSFDHFFVLDFEATCLRGLQIEPQEIIEFPCLKLSPENFEIRAKFHRYVRPIHHPELSHFCTELTGITQEMVEHEATFPEVLSDFDGWIRSETRDTSDSFSFIICGDWDLKTMLPRQCLLSETRVPDYFSQWINVKKSYHGAKRIFPRSLAAMMAGLGLTFEGRQHSGIDDSANIARIAKALAEQGFVFRNTSSRIGNP